MENQIQKNLELVQSNEQVYELELHTYHIAFLEFKYVPLDFVSVEIRIGTKTIGAISHILISKHKEQLVDFTKPNNPLSDGTCLEFVPLPIKISTIPIQVTTIEIIKDNIELVDTLITNSKIEPFEFLFTTLPLTPLQIGVTKNLYIFSTPHASEVFIMPIVTFDETLDQQELQKEQVLKIELNL